MSEATTSFEKRGGDVVKINVRKLGGIVALVTAIGGLAAAVATYPARVTAVEKSVSELKDTTTQQGRVLDNYGRLLERIDERTKIMAERQGIKQ